MFSLLIGGTDMKKNRTTTRRRKEGEMLNQAQAMIALLKNRSIRPCGSRFGETERLWLDIDGTTVFRGGNLHKSPVTAVELASLIAEQLLWAVYEPVPFREDRSLPEPGGKEMQAGEDLECQDGGNI